MKNLYLLPSEKPSRLYLGKNGNFVFGMIQNSIQSSNDDFMNQHIYITSGEGIKSGDYGLSKLNEVIKFHSGYDYRYYDKIIMTTDPDLIKASVCSIGEKFLGWFVNNPGCEEVVVKKSGGRYSFDMGGNIFIPITYKIIIPEDTVENTVDEEDETAIYTKINSIIDGGKSLDSSITGNDRCKAIDYAFSVALVVAQWQQEMNYSETEVVNLLKKYKIESGSNVDAFCFFEEFKKK